MEPQRGEYRILCLIKSVLSEKEYEDRAILVYNVKPYRDIKININILELLVRNN